MGSGLPPPPSKGLILLLGDDVGVVCRRADGDVGPGVDSGRRNGELRGVLDPYPSGDGLNGIALDDDIGKSAFACYVARCETSSLLLDPGTPLPFLMIIHLSGVLAMCVDW